MGTVELRKKWAQSIANVDDRFLRIIDALYESYKKTDEKDFYDELPKEVKQLLILSREQIKEGKVTPHKEVMAKYRQKYNAAG